MAKPQLAILFSDISGSTSLYDRLGDAVARPLITACMAQMDSAITGHNGTVIKTIGDEIMCTFLNADDASSACIQMQEDISEGIAIEGTSHPMAIRIGFHYGPVIKEKGDVFGDAVNIAARMAALAKGGQIITTKETVAEMNPVHKSSARLLDRLTVKGKRETIDIYELIWQEEDVTHIATGLFAAPEEVGRLKLIYEGQEKTLDLSMHPMSMGRGKRADMMVNDSFASREHVRIETRRGKFVLLDTSTNGTYVETQDGSFYLRREELVLRGKGRISLGRELAENPDQFISFETID
ncbi:MAG: FHA domain-containing protein [Gammaproteobacteria bacterium]|nr:FHA domain-containing protein [Gammaproteobacteria bacterium]